MNVLWPMELIYCKFWAYPNSILPSVDENFAWYPFQRPRTSNFLVSAGSLWSVILTSLKCAHLFRWMWPPPLPLICFSSDLHGSHGASKWAEGGLSPPWAPPRGYATGMAKRSPEAHLPGDWKCGKRTTMMTTSSSHHYASWRVPALILRSRACAQRTASWPYRSSSPWNLQRSHLETAHLQTDSTRRAVSPPYQQLLWHAFPNPVLYGTVHNTSKKLGPIYARSSRTLRRLPIVADVSCTSQASRSKMAQLRLKKNSRLPKTSIVNKLFLFVF